MKLTVNEEAYETRAAGSVTTLLDEMGLAGQAVVVVLNGEVLPAAARDEQALREGDRVDLFRIVGGG
ncbi:MAG: sulfur carrier protein ThiS [Deltaproteobacteria bacterium]|nr:sulfur carrier protein ThiS [Deltaproteobacteria bacterium]